MALNSTNKPYNLLLEGLRAAGMGLGIYLTKPALEKRLSKSLTLANSGINKTLKHNPANSITNPVTFELAGLGGIAAYRIYRGLKNNKKANLIEGILLTGVLFGAVAYTIGVSKKKS